MNFSLCIITENCYDYGLQNNLSFFLNEPLVDDIIVFDKDGSDIIKIRNEEAFENTLKLNLILGCKNIDDVSIKIKCGNMAKNQWIVFYDSFALPDDSFFKNAKKYIIQNELFYQKHVALSPCYAKCKNMEQPGYGFHHYLAGSVVTKENFIQTMNKQKNIKINNNSIFYLLTTGSFIYHHSIFQDIDLSKNKDLLPGSFRYNTLLLNTLMFEQLNNFEFHVVAGLEYKNQFSVKKEKAFENFEKQDIIYDLENRIWNCCKKNKIEELLFEACKNNNIELVKSYLSSGVNKNWQNSDGVTPLMIACKHGNSNVITSLLE